MTAEEFFDKKAIDEGYEDFNHYVDCGDWTEVPNKIIEWTKEFAEAYHKERVNAISDEMLALEDDYGFRVPYNGSNDFYDKEVMKHYRKGYTDFKNKLLKQ